MLMADLYYFVDTCALFIHIYIHVQYTYIVNKNNVFAVPANYMYRQCTYIVFILNVKNSKTSAVLSANI
jgi:hypothetical protein